MTHDNVLDLERIDWLGFKFDRAYSAGAETMTDMGGSESLERQ